MRPILVRSGIVAGVAAIVAAVGLFLLVTSGSPSPGDPPAIASAILAAMVGVVVGFVAGGIAFTFGQFPKAARRAAIFGTVLCTGLSGWFTYSDMKEGSGVHWSGILALWLLVWPLAFGISLWVDVKHTIAKQIVNGVRSKP